MTTNELNALIARTETAIADTTADLRECLWWSDANPMKRALVSSFRADIARHKQALCSLKRTLSCRQEAEAEAEAFAALPAYKRFAIKALALFR